MKKSIIFLFAFCFIAFACSKDESILQEDLSDSELLKSKVKTKTIKFHRASGTMEMNFQSSECVPYAQFVIKGGGNASHLGRFTVENKVCFYMENGNFISVGQWEGKLTAANGDQLNTEMVKGPYFMNNDGLAYYDYEVHSGTGRFASVTDGTLVMWGITDMATMTWELEGEGTIEFTK